MRGKKYVTFLMTGLLIMGCGLVHADWTWSPAGMPYIYTLVADSAGQHISLEANGGYWRTMDGGQSWFPESSAIRPSGHIYLQSLYALDPQADTTICRASRGPEDWYSFTFDGGQTWERFSDPDIQNAGHCLVWNRAHNVWFAADSYLFGISTDFGQTWTWSSTPVPADYSVAQDSWHDSTLFIGAFYDDYVPGFSGLWRSDDLGETWYALFEQNDLPGVHYAAFYNPLRLSNGELIVTAWLMTESSVGEALFISDNEGQDWQQIDLNGLYPILFDNSVYLEEHDTPGRLFMAASPVPGGVARSDDYGRTWYPAGGGLPQDSTWASVVYQNPAGGALFAFVSNSGLYRSMDHGDSWQAVNGLPIGLSANSLSFDDEAVFWDNSGEARYPDFQLEPPYTEWQEISVFGQRGDTVMTNWPVLHKDGLNLYTMARTPYSDSFPHYRLYTAESHDNGLTWSYGEVVAHDFEDYGANALTVGNQNRWLACVYGYSDPDSLFMSLDLGHTWTCIGTFDGWVNGIVQDAASILVVTGLSWEDGYVRRTTDFGQTWQLLGNTPVEPTIALLGDSVMGVSQGYCMLWNGSEWEIRGPIPPTNPWYSLQMAGIPGPSPLLLGATSDSTVLWESTDLGDTWQARDYNLPFDSQVAGLYMVMYDPYRNWVWAGTAIGACYVDANELSSGGPLQFKPADYTLLSVYPNPFNSVAGIRYDLLKAAKVELKVYDLEGRLVKVLADDVQTAGRHQVQVDMANEASGVYFVRLMTPDHDRTEKIVLLK